MSLIKFKRNTINEHINQIKINSDFDNKLRQQLTQLKSDLEYERKLNELLEIIKEKFIVLLDICKCISNENNCELKNDMKRCIDNYHNLRQNQNYTEIKQI